MTADQVKEEGDVWIRQHTCEQRKQVRPPFVWEGVVVRLALRFNDQIWMTLGNDEYSRKITCYACGESWSASTEDAR